MKRIAKRAFTLIELLTVIAITTILLTIIVYPVFSTFNFTRSAQAFADAQARARVVTSRISAEIGQAVAVRSSSLLVPTTLNGVAANVPQHALIVDMPAQGSATGPTSYVEVVLPYSKMDLLMPAEGDAKSGPPYTNPVNGFTDPTLIAPRGQVTLPVGIGQTIVRYFVGLRNPIGTYLNPYDGILMERESGQDNLFCLYRAQVQPLVYRAGTGSNGDTSVQFRPNLAYFQSDSVTDLQIIDYDDPRFFLADGINGSGPVTKGQRIANWLAASVRQTDLSRYDMIEPVYNKYTHQAIYDGTAPRIVSLIQFRPSHVSNDPAQGQVAVRLGEETNNAAAIAPDVFKTQFGLWSNQLIRVWPQQWDPTGNTSFNQYFVGRNDPSNGSPGAPPGFSLYYYDPALSVTDVSSGVEVFDIYTYDFINASMGRFPFSQAITAANNRSGWLGTQLIKDRVVFFDQDSMHGKIKASFDISEVGNPNLAINPLNPQNLPTVPTSPNSYGPYTPQTDPNLVGNFYDPAFASVNENFNKVWSDNPNLQPQIDRFIDLRVTPQADGSASPLHPTLGFAKCRIVPGSEIVYGPDQLPGPDYGQQVRYVRTTRNPGPNQYQINYVDQIEPNDYSLLGLTPAQMAGFNPAVYDPHNFCSAIIQPRYKKGYIKFNSDPNVPLPLNPNTGMGQIQIAYRFQFNGNQIATATTPITGSPTDVFSVDYDTRQLMSVLFTVRNYPQTTNIPNPQTVTLKATATVRNYLR